MHSDVSGGVLADLGNLEKVGFPGIRGSKWVELARVFPDQTHLRPTKLCCGYADKQNIKYKRNGRDTAEIFAHHVVPESVLLIFPSTAVMPPTISLTPATLKAFFDEVALLIGEDNVSRDHSSGALTGVATSLARRHLPY